MASMAQPPHAVNRARLWAEFGALFIAIPLLIALFMPLNLMFAALFGFTVVGLALLWMTGGYEWRALVSHWSRVPWLKVVLFGAVVGATGWAIMQMTAPEYIRLLTVERFRFLILLWLLYPLLSALPQELIFRVLFFHRYSVLFPDQRIGLLVNAALFSFAHLMYWSATVLVLTFIGGLVFALSYVRYGFPTAWILHGVAGNVLFTVGMGYYFWTGNVIRPF